MVAKGVGRSLLAIMLFVATISFMFTTPGVFDASQGGFPALSLEGGFLMKDIALLGISVWTLTDALLIGRGGPRSEFRITAKAFVYCPGGTPTWITDSVSSWNPDT